jgi:hypothetical protein
MANKNKELRACNVEVISMMDAPVGKMEVMQVG